MKEVNIVTGVTAASTTLVRDIFAGRAHSMSCGVMGSLRVGSYTYWRTLLYRMLCTCIGNL